METDGNGEKRVQGGWNRSSGRREASPRAKGASAKAVVRGVVAGAACVALGVVAMLVLRTDGPSDGDGKVKKGSGLIGEVAPAVTNRTPAAAVRPAPVDPNARPTKPGQKLNGYVMLANGELHKIYGEHTNYCASSKGPYAIFRHPSENIIAGLLSIKPGQMLIGTPRYNGRIAKDFLRSLSEPIVVSEDDPPETMELKRAVTAAKIELKAAYDRGEDIEEILLKSRGELQRLAQYRLDLRREVGRAVRKDAMSEADAKDYLDAANKMLEARGIAPLDDTPLMRVKLGMNESEEGKEIEE